jgi:hypothetical protein
VRFVLADERIEMALLRTQFGNKLDNHPKRANR